MLVSSCRYFYIPQSIFNLFPSGLLILLFVSLFVFCFWLNTESILLLIQQKPCVAKYVCDYK